jgi:uncharacterized protein YndB with AHSA1/START domain
VPTTRRRRTLRADAATLWRTVGDPHHLPRWWPRVERVEQVEAGRFTELLRTAKGRAVRADFRLAELRAPREIAWAQDVEGTPFERVLESARTTVRLTDAGAGATQVELELSQALRGFARFGGLLVRRAAARALDEALDALEAQHPG